MADDLSNYKLQLQQVEVALLTDPENAELLKLKDDIGKKSKLDRKFLKLTLFLLVSRSTNLSSKRTD